jgi:hypothetical protein
MKVSVGGGLTLLQGAFLGFVIPGLTGNPVEIISIKEFRVD